MSNSQPERPKFEVIHDHSEFSGQCLPGEDVIAILIVYRGRRYRIPWGPTHLILVDFLCRRRWIALDAWQIAAKMAEDPFVQQHGMNAPGSHRRPARTSRTAVRQQIKRIRDVLTELISRKGLPFDARAIIRSEGTSTSVTGYRITVDVTWQHWPNKGEVEGECCVPTLPIIRGLFGSEAQ